MCTRSQNSTRYTRTTGPVLNVVYDCYSWLVDGVVLGPAEPEDDLEERRRVMEERLGQSWRRPWRIVFDLLGCDDVRLAEHVCVDKQLGFRLRDLVELKRSDDLGADLVELL